MSPAKKIALMRAMFDAAVSAAHPDNFIGEVIEKQWASARGAGVCYRTAGICGDGSRL